MLKYKMPVPTQEQIENYFINEFPTSKIYVNDKFLSNVKTGALKTDEVIKYFVINGSNRLPQQLHLGVFRNGIKVKGHNLIPKELTDKTFCFDTLQDAEKYVCPCGRQACQYGNYLKYAVNTFRIQIMQL